MKTTEQINQIKVLKAFIAELVTKHKETKQATRVSGNDPKIKEVLAPYDGYRPIAKFMHERQRLFVLYQAYYVLRHEVVDIDAYAKEVESHLKSHKQNQSWPFEKFGIKIEGIRDWNNYDNLANAIKLTIQHLEKYVGSKSE